ncbi:SRPBCC family protein [bacterium]|nr:SRPBCC family protein [bacterium]NBX97692.1 SRPBCC family protein [bacterium]NDC94514.1 SRPBCC family protein [bacterium]NDD83162.1 SRPBCC family protein [bacterium]NDG29621.1 SRPBCC family protein [bacterium]
MSNTKRIQASIIIDAPLHTVFDVVTDWNKQSNWVLLTKVRATSTNSKKAGGTIEAFTGIGSFGFNDTMVITAWSYGTRCEVSHTGNIVKGRGVFETSKKGTATQFTWTEYVEVPFGFMGEIGWFIVKPIALIGLKTTLKRLKNYITELNK